MSDYRSLRTDMPLPVPLPIVTVTGRKIQAVKVDYSVAAWDNGTVVRVAAVYDASNDNRAHFALTDLPDDIPDAPQWFLDAVDAFLAEAGESR